MISLDDNTPVPSGTKSNSKQALRDRAIERPLTMKNQELESQSANEIRHTLHELHVHQIELEIQNEELRLAQVQLETSRARYSDLYELAPAGYCTLGRNGLILEANLTAATMGDADAALNYLAPFVFRVAISDNRMVAISRGKMIRGR